MEKLRSLRDAVGYILLFVAVQYLCSLVASYGVLAYFYRMDPGASAEEYVAFTQAFDSRYGTALLSLSEVITLAAVWAMGRARGLGFGAMIGRGRGISQSLVPWLLLAGLCGNVFVSGAMDLLPFSQALQDSYQQASSALDSSWMLMNVLSVAVLAPITEEVVFRGLALSRLRQAMPAWLAVLAQGLVFGLIHGQLLWMLYAAVFGVVLGWVRVKTGSLGAAILLHVGFNVSSFFAGLFYILAPQNLWGELFVCLLGGVGLVACLFQVARQSRGSGPPLLPGEGEEQA